MTNDNDDETPLFAGSELGQTSSSLPSVTNNWLLTKIRMPDTLCRADPLEILDFPTRVNNSLKKWGIKTVGQFYDLSKKEALRIPNVGGKSYIFFETVKKNIAENFGELSDKPSLRKITVIEKFGELSNKFIQRSLLFSDSLKTSPIPEEVIPRDMLVDLLLERCGVERSKDLILKRYGLLTGERKTLEEIGENLGVTRERVRQIQEKALSKMRHPCNKARKSLIGETEKLLFDNYGIITDEEADQKFLLKYKGMNCDGSSILDLECDLGWIQSYRIKDVIVFSPVIENFSLEKICRKIVSEITKADAGISLSSILKVISEFRIIRESRFNAKEFILKYCLIDPRIEDVSKTLESLSNKSDNPDDHLVFRHYTAGSFPTKLWVSLITNIFEQVQTPLHFTEISNKLSDLTSDSGRNLDVRRVHSILIESNIYAQTGIRGTYGLTSWGLRKETTPELIEECLKKAGFPLHWKQILNYINKFKDSKKQSVISVLENNKRFERLDAGIYGLKKT